MDGEPGGGDRRETGDGRMGMIRRAVLAAARNLVTPEPLSVGGAGRQEAASWTRVAEPRVEFLARLLGTVLPAGADGAAGNGGAGFRLNRLGDWLVPSGDDPDAVLHALRGQCRVNCRFCYQRGTPAAVPRPPAASAGEIRARLDLFARGYALFPRPRVNTDEMLTHPAAFSVMRELRRRTDRPFRIVTNGACLTRGLIRELAALRPVTLQVSLGSADPRTRRRVMGDPRARVAIDSLRLLRRSGVPYTVAIVMWPGVTFDDMDRTINYAAAQGAGLVFVQLPGYTRYFRPTPAFVSEDYWARIVGRVQRLRRVVELPLVVTPAFYEESLAGITQDFVTVRGTVAGSPGRRAGVRRGERVFEVQGLPVGDGTVANGILRLCQEAGGPVELTLGDGRGGRRRVTLEFSRGGDYPYVRPYQGAPYGLVLQPGVDRSRIDEILERCRLAGLRRVLVLSSRLLAPFYRKIVRTHPAARGLEVAVEPVRNEFFGGNILVGDLLVVDDFVGAVERWTSIHGRPDAVFIPTSPFAGGNWMRDLTGRPAGWIERRTGVPVEFVDCRVIP